MYGEHERKLRAASQSLAGSFARQESVENPTCGCQPVSAHLGSCTSLGSKFVPKIALQYEASFDLEMLEPIASDGTSHEGFI